MLNKERAARVRENMKRAGLDQIVVSSTESVFYLTGIYVKPMERLLALYLTSDGEATLYANEIFGLESTPDLPVVTHRDGEDAVHDLAKAVRPGVLGIDKFLYSKFLIALMSARADLKPALGSAPVDLARMCKDEAEREAMRHASKVNDKVMGEIQKQVRAGAVESELAAEVNRLYRENGGTAGPQLVCFGPNGADPHHGGDETVIKPGDSVIFDIFAPVGRYWCDMTRTVFFGSVSEKQREVYELVRRANEAAEARAKPGVLLSELDATARGVIADAGYGKYFTHRLGHGCGLECHEPPDVSGATEVRLQPGMVFSVEPGIYLPGAFGVRIEDLVLVTETGCEVLNKFPKELAVL